MSRKQSPRPALTEWQKRALAELRAQAKNLPRLVSAGKQERDDDGNLYVQFAITTDDLPAPTVDGLTFEPTERFVLRVTATDDHPPAVLLDHARFLGTPHVLSGIVLCLYLDESREWDPESCINGPQGILNRLWDWMRKATQNDFDPETALYHAVGGVPHITPGTPAIVIRALPTTTSRAATAHLTHRAGHRLDLTTAPNEGLKTSHVPVYFADADMPFGAGHDDLGLLLGLIRRPRPLGIDAYTAPPKTQRRIANPSRHQEACITTRAYVDNKRCEAHDPPNVPPPYETTPDAAFFTALAASASRNPNGTPQHLILAVPHPTGGPHHLLALQLPPQVADSLRHLVRTRTTALIPYNPSPTDLATQVEWCFVSDERTDVTTRRDTSRPVAALHNKTVVVLGCGGLGSWIAEFVVRAGAKRIVISDQGRVTGGLLVRQNYVEADNGAHKATALRDRLQAISDTVEIEVHGPLTTTTLAEAATKTDLIIDATISLKMTHQLDTVATTAGRKSTIAQVATDARSGTLGIATINPPSTQTTMTQMDQNARDQVRATGHLERYRYFWEEPGPGDELVPTRGCSAPTFHGSAADLAALSGGLTTLIARHLTTPNQGTHLMALPHADINPAHKYLPYEA